MARTDRRRRRPLTAPDGRPAQTATPGAAGRAAARSPDADGPAPGSAGAWPAAPVGDRRSARRPRPRRAARRRAVAAIGGGTGGGGMGGMLGSGPATPELLARVDALPPADRATHGTSPPEHRSVQPRAGRCARCAGCWSWRWSWSLLDAGRTICAPGADALRRRQRRHAGRAGVIWAASGGWPRRRRSADYLVQRLQMVVAGRAGETVLYQLRLREFAPPAAARAGLLRARDGRPDHDPDDHGRRRAVDVPADRVWSPRSSRWPPSPASPSCCVVMDVGAGR